MTAGKIIVAWLKLFHINKGTHENETPIANQQCLVERWPITYKTHCLVCK